MNIFLPYDNDIQESIKALDDLRLNKQILECFQLLKNAVTEKMGGEIDGYKNHPVYLYYKNDLKFLYDYGVSACNEYAFRFGKTHNLAIKYYYLISCYGELFADYIVKPFYAEGIKNSPNCIRTTENVGRLFQEKLIRKWQNDKRKPKWTKRETPRFYKEFLDEIC